MNSIEYYKERFDQLQSANAGNSLAAIRQDAFTAFSKMGIPTHKNEEWKYTRISSLFNKEYQFAGDIAATSFSKIDILLFRLPGHEQANELFFINGFYSQAFSVIRSNELIVHTLEEAATNEYKDIVAKYFGHSSDYLKDGINALNTAFVNAGVFINV
jgi:Fe-S cluster assembly protein SufD